MDFMPQVISGSDEEIDRGCEDGMTFNSEMEGDEIPPCQLEEKDIFNDLEENHSPVNVAGTTEKEPEPIKMKVVRDTHPSVKEEPKTTKPKQKRRMTEKQREALEKNRAKAIETRKRNAKARRELKELEKKKKQMDLDKLREEVNGKPKVDRVVEFVEKPIEIKEKPKPKAIKTFTQDEVNEITFTAIKNYDMIKKARKIEKQEKHKKEREEQLERDRLLKIVNRQNTSNNFWDNCY